MSRYERADDINGPYLSGSTKMRIFSLGPNTTPCDPSILVNPKVDGISIRDLWSNIEPSPGVYNWSFFDSEVARAVAAGKQIMMRVLSQNNAIPSWVPTIGGQTFVANDGTTVWIWWDPIIAPLFNEMFHQMGLRYGSTPNLKIIALVCATDTSGDWGVPHDAGGSQNWTNSAAFTCPAYGSTVNAPTTVSADMTQGQYCFIPGFGWFQAFVGSGTLHTTLYNPGTPGNANSGTVPINTTIQVSDITTLTGPIYGYTSQRLINACVAHIDAMHLAFPRQILTLACGRNGTLDPTLDYVCEALAAYGYRAYPHHFAIQKNQFATNTPTPAAASVAMGGSAFKIMGDWYNSGKQGGQFLWWNYQDTTYTNNQGITTTPPSDWQGMMNTILKIARDEYESDWLETYQTDCVNLVIDQ